MVLKVLWQMYDATASMIHTKWTKIFILKGSLDVEKMHIETIAQEDPILWLNCHRQKAKATVLAIHLLYQISNFSTTKRS